MPAAKDSGAPRSFVEFVYRVHSDGRREPSAAVFLVDDQGRVIPGPGRPAGALGEFVAKAVAEVAGTDRRRVKGMTTNEVLDAYPDLELADVQEALHYAAEAVRERELPLAG